MSENEPISLEQFLDNKTDYSHLLVHLTRRDEYFSAKEVLSLILDDLKLKAYNTWCICKYDFNEQEDVSLGNKLKVVCFTETPLEQIKTLLRRVVGRQYQPEPYGLVFTKKFIREKGGNPVFYLTQSLARPLRTLFRSQKKELSNSMFKLLALTSICDEGNDWHWEREWRFVGDLDFTYDDVYCGLCPEEDIFYFRDEYKQVKFIDPRWSNKEIIDELVKKEPSTLAPDDIPF